MIKAILVFNNHGKPRLSKFYQYFNEDMQQQIIKETFQLVSKRDDNVCNFLEGGSLIGGSDYKLIYRHYATLYFVFCVDSSESELGILDLIQVFVETLDKCFENVCELDLIFHADAVHHILSELVMGGMVLQTNMSDIMARIEEQNKLVKQEAGISAAPARAVRQSSASALVDTFVLQRLTATTQTLNHATALSSLAAYAFNSSHSNSINTTTTQNNNNNNNSLNFSNKNLDLSSVTTAGQFAQYLNQSIYEPIEDNDVPGAMPNAGDLASVLNFDYYQSQAYMEPEGASSFEFNSNPTNSRGSQLAHIADKHEQSLKLVRESFDLNVPNHAKSSALQRTQKKKHKKSKKPFNCKH
uniref:AP complex mu/sigma subunit domain-containing protein n=1 Tax=Glossina pallidipes TaxID=7398 RepID=A0A1B0ABP1_GLOPL